jgi:hypothetical protein
LKIVAYYQAQRNVGDVGLGPVGEKLLGKLREQFKDAIGFVVRLLRFWFPVCEPYVPTSALSQIDGEDFGTDSAALNVRQDLSLLQILS